MGMAQVRDTVVDFVRRLAVAIDAEVDIRAREAVIRALRGSNGRSSLGAAANRRRRPRSAAASNKDGVVPKWRRVQGQYLGRLRKLTGKNRVRVKAVARTKGVEAAIKLADRLSM
jgi:hypothetical protein